jgi:hypothetical protein
LLSSSLFFFLFFESFFELADSQTIHHDLLQEAVGLLVDLGLAFGDEHAAYQERITHLAKAKELTPQLLQAHKKVR